jgi:hypothetical protein
MLCHSRGVHLLTNYYIFSDGWRVYAEITNEHILVGKPKHRLESNINIDLKEIGYKAVDSYLSESGYEPITWMVMNLRVP